MKLSILLVLCLGIASVVGECDDLDHSGFAVYGCYDDPYIANIKCTDDVCECKTYEGETSEGCGDVTAEDIAALSAADLDGEKCKEICEISYAAADASEENKCVFYRWVMEGSTKRCIMMNADQCAGTLPCEKDQCLSGQAGCDSSDETTTAAPVSSSKCAANVTFEPSAVHWLCFTENTDNFNIYGSVEAPTGVYCKTAKKCSAFDKDGTYPIIDGEIFKNLWVQCNPENIEGSKTWGKKPNTYNDVSSVMSPDQLTLLDPVCKPNPLTLNASKLQEPGVSFICENPANLEFTEDSVVVTAPNTCALLCNYHNVLTIEDVVEEDGTAQWRRYPDDGSNVDGEVVNDNDENVKCWDFMNH